VNAFVTQRCTLIARDMPFVWPQFYATAYNSVHCPNSSSEEGRLFLRDYWRRGIHPPLRAALAQAQLGLFWRGYHANLFTFPFYSIFLWRIHWWI